MLHFTIKHYQFKGFTIILIMLFLFITGLYKLLIYADSTEENKLALLHKDATRLTTSEKLLIKEGDFILRRGFGYFSDIIASKLNDGKYDITHAGIVIKEKDSLFVIHSLSSDVSKTNGVQIQSLDDFLKYSAPKKIIVTRLKNCTDSLAGKIAVHARYYLNKKIPFDNSGNFNDDSAFFCTELIWHILEHDLNSVHLPADNNQRKELYYKTNNMYNTQYFDIIINQFTF